MNVSGRYSSNNLPGSPFTMGSVSLDVDGEFPQMAVSGLSTVGLTSRVHWLAHVLSPTDIPNQWSGMISRKWGTESQISHTSVIVQADGDTAVIKFQGEGWPDREVALEFQARTFRDVTLEFDTEEGQASVMNYETGSHLDRPGSLNEETLSIQAVFERAGFRVLSSGGYSVVPRTGAGSDSLWTNAEMHDAMQIHFSTLATLPANQRNKARWALWTFFASRHMDGRALGGIMFDSIGEAERQGTALFLDSFIADSPVSETSPDP